MSTPGRYQAMTVAPHRLAAQTGQKILAQGGNALEAMVAMAAAIGVLYPHMTGLGGDAFWLIHRPKEPPVGIDASGPLAQAANLDFYRARGCLTMPETGPWAASTMAGTVGGWIHALRLVPGRLSVSQLLADAIAYARDGFAISASHRRALMVKPAFAKQLGSTPFVGDADGVCRQPLLAATLTRLAHAGLADFYQGEIAQTLAEDCVAADGPLRLVDFSRYAAHTVTPLTITIRAGRVYNLPLPTQGAVSLALLGVLDRIGLERYPVDSVDYVHRLVEATKAVDPIRQALLRADGATAIADLAPSRLAALAQTIDGQRAALYRQSLRPGGTVWMGAIDQNGCAVSFIQSLYHEFGSGWVSPRTGIIWHNRGSMFALQEPGRLLAPGRQPFHTLNPALAELADGRVLVYGTMGGDGQPQTQAAIFTRAIVYKETLQAAITAPRWLLGRTWGVRSDTLKLESRFPESLAAGLVDRGHVVEWLADYDEAVGHAGALMFSPNGIGVGGFDPRSDGAVCGNDQGDQGL